LPPSGRARGGTQITLFGMTPVGHLGGHVADQNGGSGLSNAPHALTEGNCWRTPELD
jgi:hypothetical protein